MPEWPLYPPVIAHLREQGFLVASQVTDPGGTRFELDVVAFTPDLDDVRIVEAKRAASDAFADQCLDRLRYARRVLAAAPAGEAERMTERLPGAVGVLVVGDDVRVLREAEPVDDRIERGTANRLHRALKARLAEGNV